MFVVGIVPSTFETNEKRPEKLTITVTDSIEEIMAVYTLHEWASHTVSNSMMSAIPMGESHLEACSPSSDIALCYFHYQRNTAELFFYEAERASAQLSPELEWHGLMQLTHEWLGHPAGKLVMLFRVAQVAADSNDPDLPTWIVSVEV